MSRWGRGWLFGSVAASLETALLFAAGEGSNMLLVAQSVLFRLATGVLVTIADVNTGLGIYIDSLLLTALAFSPWIVNLVLATGNYAHIPPLAIQVIVFGLMFGYARKSSSKRGLQN